MANRKIRPRYVWLAIIVACSAFVLIPRAFHSDYDPELCAMWTDLYISYPDGVSRVAMDKYCTR